MFIHEIAAARPQTLIDYPRIQVAIDHHATPEDVGRVFTQTRPKLAMLTHLVMLPPDPPTIEELCAGVTTEYDGIVLVAEDLMTIEIGNSISVIPAHHGRNGAGHKPLKSRG